MLHYLLLIHSLKAETLTLQESLSLVKSQSPEVQIARLQSDQSNIERLKILTNIVRADASGSWLNFGEPLDVYLIGNGNTEVDCSSFEAFGFGELCDGFSEPVRLRDAKIFDGSIQIALPISSLYSIVEGHSANQHLVDIKDLEVQQTEQRIALSVIEIYLKTLELQEQIALLNDSLIRLQSRERSVQAFITQGLVHPVQGMELQYALQQTAFGLQQSQQGLELLCKQMTLLLDLESPFTPQPLKSNILPPKQASLDANLTYQIASHRAQAAKDGLQAAYGDLIPSISLLGAQTNTQGQGALTPTSQRYLGVNVQGTFGLGQKWMTVKQRQIDLTMAQSGLNVHSESVLLKQQQLQNAWLNSQAQISLAASKVEIETIKRTQAQANFDAQQITITDLLDAEGDFADSQIELLRAQHQNILAQARYQQSINADTLYFSTSRDNSP